ncbi:MAG TPA: hypothetical protein PK624_11530 [Spirochaetota bacterium]|nr:hypothetical protein [Spirochaetota bacterium]HPK57120.1 hypothetical protein [Spirochaetota bacterium]
MKQYLKTFFACIIFWAILFLQTVAANAQEKANKENVSFISAKIKFPINVSFGINLSPNGSFMTEKVVPDPKAVSAKIESLKMKWSAKKDPDNAVELAGLYRSLNNIKEANEWYIKAEKLLQMQLNNAPTDKKALTDTVGLYIELIHYNAKNEKLINSYAKLAFKNAFTLLDIATTNKERIKTYQYVGYLYFMLGQYDKANIYFSKLNNVEGLSFETLFQSEFVQLMLFCQNNICPKAEFHEKLKTTDIANVYDYRRIQNLIKKNPNDLRYKALLHFEHLIFFYFKGLITDQSLTLDFNDKKNIFSVADTALLNEIESFFVKIDNYKIMKRFDLYCILAMIYSLKKEPAKIVSYYEKAFNEEPTDFQTMTSLVYVYMVTFKNYEKAVNVIERKNTAKANAINYVWIASVLGKNEQYTKAIEAIQDGLRMEPTNIDVQFTAGALYMKSGDYTKGAIYINAVYDKCSQKYTHYDEVIIARAAVLLSQNKHKESFDLLMNLYNQDISSNTKKRLEEILTNVFKQEKPNDSEKDGSIRPDYLEPR